MHLDTEVMRRTHVVLRNALEANMMTAIWGDAGLGKTYAVEHFTAGLDGIRVARFDAPVNPTVRAVALELLGALVGTAVEMDTWTARKEVNAILSDGRPTVVVLDEAQRLKLDGFELVRSYHDACPHFAVVFVGGPNAWEVIRNHRMLESRIRYQVQFSPLPRDEFVRLLPNYNLIYEGIEEHLADFLYRDCRGGYLRDLYHVTCVAETIMRRSGHSRFDTSLLEAALLQRGVR